MAGVLLLPNIATHPWLDDLMPKTLYNDNSWCEKYHTDNRRQILATAAESRKKISIFIICIAYDFVARTNWEFPKGNLLSDSIINREKS